MPEFKSQRKNRKPLPIVETASPLTPTTETQASPTPEQLAAVATISQSRPSTHAARVEAIIKSKRVQLNFSNTPKAIVDEFDRLAKTRKMAKKEYFYYLLRQDGADIPDYSELDARRRVAR